MTFLLSYDAICRTARSLAALRHDQADAAPMPVLDPAREAEAREAVRGAFCAVALRIAPYVADFDADQLMLELRSPRAMDASAARMMRQSLEQAAALAALCAVFPGDADTPLALGAVVECVRRVLRGPALAARCAPHYY